MSSGFKKPTLYKGSSGNVTYGSESNANFLDVLSVGPVTSIEDVYVNDTSIQTGEFPLSEFFTHTGDGVTRPFEGDFPYVERAYSIGKQADSFEGDDGDFSTTTFTRAVSGVGVEGIRISFNAPQFIHKDNKNRRKIARAYFTVRLLDENGTTVKTSTGGATMFYATNPTSVQATLLARPQDLNRVWEYEVEMRVLTNYYRTVVGGNWTAAIVTEFYKDTQTYKDIAMVSGRVVASDVSGSVPKREYLVKGYKVDVPDYTGGSFNGKFVKQTSSSHAWNAMAVLIDEKWGAGLPLDKISITDFVEFDKYLTTQLPDGSRRYSHSQELIKADNYFRIAAQIVGAADGKLYEDTSGRIGVIVDKQTDKRRVITSYDLQDEKVKRTTVPEKKKTNYVEMDFSDKTNNYQKNIISVQDDSAIIKNGLIKQSLKSDTCTDPREALRVIKKVLVTSQVTASSYVFTVGHTHEDIQIGEVVALFDRNFSRVNYCGKVGSGSTLTRINVDPRTPVDLEGIENPHLVLDNSRGIPTQLKITSWTDKSITLQSPLSAELAEFTSFGVQSGNSDGLKPTLVKVMGVTDNAGVLQVEGVEYNDSLYSHVEKGTALQIPLTRILPPAFATLEGLQLLKTSQGIYASWDAATTPNYVYYWKAFTNDLERDPTGAGILVKSGEISTANTLLPYPLEPVDYEISVYILDPITGQSSSVKSSRISLGLTESGTSTITPPTGFDTEEGGGVFLGRGFKLKWEQADFEEVTPFLMGYILRVTDAGKTLEVRLPNTARSYEVTSQELTGTFGNTYGRNFVARLIAYDDTLKTKDALVRTINNIAPIAPDVTVRVTGDVSLSTIGNIPEDVIGSLVYVWEGSDVLLPRPADALEFRSNQIAEVDLPDGTLVYDNRNYIFEAAWVDGFGERGLNFTRETLAFGPDVLIPEPMSLRTAIAYDIDKIKVEFDHDGVWLEKLKIYYKKTNSATGFVLADGYTFDGSDARVTYDPQSMTGTFILDSLAYNSEYELFTTVSNISSADSDPSNTVIGSVVPYANVEEIREDLNNILDEILDGRDKIGGQSLVNALVDIHTLKDKDKDLEKLQFYTDLAQLEQRDGLLAAGDSIATVDTQIKAVSDDQGAIAQEIVILKASSGTQQGQIDANVIRIGQAESNIDGTARAITGLTTEVQNTQGQLSDAQLILDSTIDDLGIVSSRAYLGVSNTVGGKTTVTGITADSATNGLRFQGDKIQFDDTSGNRALYYNSSKNKWTLDGELVIGGYTVESEADIRGLDGQSGAGFYGSLYASISWNTTTATQRFTTLVGRAPVQYDIFTQTRTDGRDSQTKSFKNGSWVAPSLLVNGDIIATGSVNGNRITAGTEISAPVISGGTIKLVGTRFMEYWSATPFGVDQLIEWYGEKVSGINWNTSTQQPIPSGMLKSNSKTYKSASGDVYFGGTFLAGTLSSSQSSTELISTPSTTVVFGSNGGIIVVSVSYSFNTTKRGNVSGTPEQTAICPTLPVLSVVTGTLFLERKSGTHWIVVKQQAISGSYDCQNGEYIGQTGNIPYRASSSSGSVFSYTDSLGVATNREYRVRASLNNFYYTGTTNQYISVATSE